MRIVCGERLTRLACAELQNVGSNDFAEILARVRPASHTHVTIGVFDGVHRGHQRLITGMIEAAHATDGVAVVLTFDPHPAVTLSACDADRADMEHVSGRAFDGRRQPFDSPFLLTTVEERAEVLAALGLDILVVLPFTQATARTPATDFVDALVRHLHLTQLWGGPDFAIGHRREGDIPFLRRLGAERGFTVHVVGPLVWGRGLVSSSRVRGALEAGDLSQVTGCLGRPYRLTGSVVRGREVGHSIGIPTANISPPPGRLVPASGVYACQAHTERLGTYPSVTNIGVHPTFGPSPDSAAPRIGNSLLCGAGRRKTPVVETHLLDFDADLYGQVLALDFIARLRDERTFPASDALVEQIYSDIAQARTILDGVRSPALLQDRFV